MKVAIPYYYELHSQLKEMYPEVEWIKVDNASAAFHKVKEGERDALVDVYKRQITSYQR